MNNNDVKVLYIGGYSRSGSTLLLRMLGQIEGFFSVGELWDIWNRSFTENQLCGCGQPFKGCDFWQAVITEAFGGMAQVDVQKMQELKRAVHGNGAIPQLMMPALRTAHYKEQLATYSDVLSKLYRAIQKVSGCRMIVDSSKVPPYAFLLNEIPGISLSILHLIRDSRAAAYSWQRKKVRPEIHWKTEHMDRYSPFRSAIEWDIMNVMLQAMKHRTPAYRTVRYEDLVTAPRETLLSIGRFLHEDWSDVNFFGNGQTVNFGVDHTVSGNPNRFQQGAVVIRPDTEWQQKMARSQKYIVTALTWPLLWQQGYMGKGQAESNGAVAKDGGPRVAAR
jgi:hypothetical protein